VTSSPWPARARRRSLGSRRDFGISESCLARWLKIADREDGLAPPAAGDRGGGGKDESAELRELRRRNKLLEQENEILRRATAYFARDVLPKSTRWSRSSPPRRSLSR
jgi:transposase